MLTKLLRTVTRFCNLIRAELGNPNIQLNVELDELAFYRLQKRSEIYELVHSVVIEILSA